jgi:ech hydrogenase subunit E
MPSRTIVPFGPQHPVFPEPLQLKLAVEDEKVGGSRAFIGYVHRGLEKGAELNDFVKNIFLAERVCGICSFIHSWTYCSCIEELMDIEVPPRAQYLRLIFAELSRIHSHLLWLGCLLMLSDWKVFSCSSGGSGAEPGHAGGWRRRTGNPFDLHIGGMRRNLDEDMRRAFLSETEEIRRDYLRSCRCC